MTFDSVLLIGLSVLTILGFVYILLSIPGAIKKANDGRPYHPRQQMGYNKKTKKIEFFAMSQRTAWWITFWDNL